MSELTKINCPTCGGDAVEKDGTIVFDYIHLERAEAAERALAEALAREALLLGTTLSFHQIKLPSSYPQSALLLLALARAAVTMRVIARNGNRVIEYGSQTSADVMNARDDLWDTVDVALADPTLAQALKEQK